MAEIEEVHEIAEEHGAKNKLIALLIAALALMLAFAEAGNGNNENASIDLNIEASNLWSFYQAKTIRMTTMQTAAEQAELDLIKTADPAVQTAIRTQIEKWRATAKRYDSEPSTGEGRKELSAKAISKQEERKITMQRKELYEVAAKAFQIGIVLASAMIITGLAPLVWGAMLLGLAGAILMGFAMVAPMAIHLPF